MAERIPLEIRISEIQGYQEWDEKKSEHPVWELLDRTGLQEYCRGIAKITANTAISGEMKKNIPMPYYKSNCTLGKYLEKLWETGRGKERYQQMYCCLIFPFSDLWEKIEFEQNWMELDEKDPTPFD